MFLTSLLVAAKWLSAQVGMTCLEGGMSPICAKLGLGDLLPRLPRRSILPWVCAATIHPGCCGQAGPGSLLLLETTTHSQSFFGHKKAIPISGQQEGQAGAAPSIPIKSPTLHLLGERPAPR